MTASPSRLRRLANGAAHLGWRALLGAIPLGLLAGIVEALVWTTGPAKPPFEGEEGACTGGRQPPCFDGLPDLSSLPLELVPTLLYVFAVFIVLALSLPSLLASLGEALYRRWRSAALACLTFAGPMLVFIGTETVPHAVAVLPCRILDADLCSRFHQLEHVLFGLIPLTLLYRAVLLRWSPSVITTGPIVEAVGKARSVRSRP